MLLARLEKKGVVKVDEVEEAVGTTEEEEEDEEDELGVSLLGDSNSDSVEICEGERELRLEIGDVSEETTHTDMDEDEDKSMLLHPASQTCNGEEERERKYSTHTSGIALLLEE